jgi:hypothetical protein
MLNTQSSDNFVEIIKEAIRKRTGEILEEEIKIAQDNIKRRLKEEADKLALTILDFYEISQNAHELIIRVRKDET